MVVFFSSIEAVFVFFTQLVKSSPDTLHYCTSLRFDDDNNLTLILYNNQTNILLWRCRIRAWIFNVVFILLKKNIFTFLRIYSERLLPTLPSLFLMWNAKSVTIAGENTKYIYIYFFYSLLWEKYDFLTCKKNKQYIHLDRFVHRFSKSLDFFSLFTH